MFVQCVGRLRQNAGRRPVVEIMRNLFVGVAMSDRTLSEKRPATFSRLLVRDGSVPAGSASE